MTEVQPFIKPQEEPYDPTKTDIGPLPPKEPTEGDQEQKQQRADDEYIPVETA
jgi:hypothetical protein